VLCRGGRAACIPSFLQPARQGRVRPMGGHGCLYRRCGRLGGHRSAALESSTAPARAAVLMNSRADIHVDMDSLIRAQEKKTGTRFYPRPYYLELFNQSEHRACLWADNRVVGEVIRTARAG